MVGVGSLVSGNHYQELAIREVPKEDSSDNREGSIEVFFKERPTEEISNRFKKGQITSFFQIRNKDIRLLRDEIDRIAFDFANTVNAIHRRGYVNRKIETEKNGRETSLFDAKGAITGIKFFDVSLKREGAALSLKLSDEVQKRSFQYCHRP